MLIYRNKGTGEVRTVLRIELVTVPDDFVVHVSDVVYVFDDGTRWTTSDLEAQWTPVENEQDTNDAAFGQAQRH